MPENTQCDRYCDSFRALELMLCIACLALVFVLVHSPPDNEAWPWLVVVLVLTFGGIGIVCAIDIMSRLADSTPMSPQSTMLMCMVAVFLFVASGIICITIYTKDDYGVIVLVLGLLAFLTAILFLVNAIHICGTISETRNSKVYPVVLQVANPNRRSSQRSSPSTYSKRTNNESEASLDDVVSDGRRDKANQTTPRPSIIYVNPAMESRRSRTTTPTYVRPIRCLHYMDDYDSHTHMSNVNQVTQTSVTYNEPTPSTHSSRTVVFENVKESIENDEAQVYPSPSEPRLEMVVYRPPSHLSQGHIVRIPVTPPNSYVESSHVTSNSSHIESISPGSSPSSHVESIRRQPSPPGEVVPGGEDRRVEILDVVVHTKDVYVRVSSTKEIAATATPRSYRKPRMVSGTMGSEVHRSDAHDDWGAPSAQSSPRTNLESAATQTDEECDCMLVGPITEAMSKQTPQETPPTSCCGLKKTPKRPQEKKVMPSKGDCTRCTPVCQCPVHVNPCEKKQEPNINNHPSDMDSKPDTIPEAPSTYQDNVSMRSGTPTDTGMPQEESRHTQDESIKDKESNNQDVEPNEEYIHREIIESKEGAVVVITRVIRTSSTVKIHEVEPNEQNVASECSSQGPSITGSRSTGPTTSSVSAPIQPHENVLVVFQPKVAKQCPCHYRDVRNDTIPTNQEPIITLADITDTQNSEENDIVEKDRTETRENSVTKIDSTQNISKDASTKSLDRIETTTKVENKPIDLDIEDGVESDETLTRQTSLSSIASSLEPVTTNQICQVDFQATNTKCTCRHKDIHKKVPPQRINEENQKRPQSVPISTIKLGQTIEINNTVSNSALNNRTHIRYRYDVIVDREQTEMNPNSATITIQELRSNETIGANDNVNDSKASVKSEKDESDSSPEDLLSSPDSKTKKTNEEGEEGTTTNALMEEKLDKDANDTLESTSPSEERCTCRNTEFEMQECHCGCPCCNPPHRDRSEESDVPENWRNLDLPESGRSKSSDSARSQAPNLSASCHGKHHHHSHLYDCDSSSRTTTATSTSKQPSGKTPQSSQSSFKQASVKTLVSSHSTLKNASSQTPVSSRSRSLKSERSSTHRKFLNSAERLPTRTVSFSKHKDVEIVPTWQNVLPKNSNENADQSMFNLLPSSSSNEIADPQNKDSTSTIMNESSYNEKVVDDLLNELHELESVNLPSNSSSHLTTSEATEITTITEMPSDASLPAATGRSENISKDSQDKIMATTKRAPRSLEQRTKDNSNKKVAGPKIPVRQTRGSKTVRTSTVTKVKDQYISSYGGVFPVDRDAAPMAHSPCESMRRSSTRRSESPPKWQRTRPCAQRQCYTTRPSASQNYDDIPVRGLILPPPPRTPCQQLVRPCQYQSAMTSPCSRPRIPHDEIPVKGLPTTEYFFAPSARVCQRCGRYHDPGSQRSQVTVPVVCPNFHVHGTVDVDVTGNTSPQYSGRLSNYQPRCPPPPESYNRYTTSPTPYVIPPDNTCARIISHETLRRESLPPIPPPIKSPAVFILGRANVDHGNYGQQQFGTTNSPQDDCACGAKIREINDDEDDDFHPTSNDRIDMRRRYNDIAENMFGFLWRETETTENRVQTETFRDVRGNRTPRSNRNTERETHQNPCGSRDLGREEETRSESFSSMEDKTSEHDSMNDNSDVSLNGQSQERDKQRNRPRYGECKREDFHAPIEVATRVEVEPFLQAVQIIPIGRAKQTNNEKTDSSQASTSRSSSKTRRSTTDKQERSPRFFRRT